MVRVVAVVAVAVRSLVLSMSLCAAAQPLPYGPACFYYSPATTRGDEDAQDDPSSQAAEREGDSRGDKVFAPLPRGEDATRRTDCQEALFAQYHVLEGDLAERTSRCWSYFHSGPGQLGLTDNHRRRMDVALLLEPGHFVFLNYHSELHYTGHLEGCPRETGAGGGRSPGSGNPEEEEKGERAESGLGGGEADRSQLTEEERAPSDEGTQEGEASRSQLTEEERAPSDEGTQEGEGDEEEEEEEGRGKRRRRDVSPFWEPDEEEGEWNEMDEYDDDLEWAMESGQFLATEGTKRGDEDVREYLDCLNGAVASAREGDPTFPPLVFEYRAEFACHYFHGNVFRGRRTGNLYGSLQRLLVGEHPEDSLVTGGALLGRAGGVGEPALLRRLLQDDSLSGFVTVRGGWEEKRDLSSLMQGYCLGKFGSSRDPAQDLGGFAELQASAAGANLAKMCEKKRLTMTRLGYGPKQLTTMSLQNLRFLVQQRSFRGFEVIHFIGYELRPWLFGLIFRVLQERHRLKREQADDVTGITVCKLYLNSLYGFSYKESKNFNTTTLVSQSWLEQKRVSGDPNLVACTLVGTRPARRYSARRDTRCRRRSTPSSGSRPAASTPREEMVFALSRKNPDALVRNIAQLASTVLCNSRNIFYAKILFLLTVMDPGRLQLAYVDTDSVMLWAHHRDPVDNVRPEFLDLFKEYYHSIFEDLSSSLPQNNRLKNEGIFSSSFFYTLKQYTLLPLPPLEGGEENGGEALRKTKGIPRQARVKMQPSHFRLPDVDDGQDPLQKRDKLLSASWIMRGTRGLQVMMSIRTSALPNPVNLKRHSLVRMVLLFLTMQYSPIFCFSVSPHDVPDTVTPRR